MKCTAIFLVLSMVILMAEPGESFIGGLFSIGKFIHSLIANRRRRHGLEELQALEDLEKMDKQQKQFEKRSLDFKPARAAFR